MKKLVLVTALALVACGAEETPSSEATEPTTTLDQPMPEVDTERPAPLDDGDDEEPPAEDTGDTDPPT